MKMTTENELKLLENIKELIAENRNLNNQLEIKNNALRDTERQLKEKYSNDDFVLVDRHDLRKIVGGLEDVESDLRNICDDVEDMEYQYLADISNSISGVSYSIDGTKENVQDLQSDLHALTTPKEEEVKEVIEGLKKVAAKKTTAVKVVVKK